MGYQIEYNNLGPKKPQKNYTWVGIIVSVSMLLLVAGAIGFKETALPWIQEVLLPGDPAVTAAALEGVVEDLKNGDSLFAAIQAFCKEIMKYAPIP